MYRHVNHYLKGIVWRPKSSCIIGVTLQGAPSCPEARHKNHPQRRTGRSAAGTSASTAGFSQRDLAKETGISQRMIAYYEKQPQYPPLHVLTILTKALGFPRKCSAEELKKTDDKVKDIAYPARLKQVEGLDEKEKRQILQLLDTFIENNRLKQKSISA